MPGQAEASALRGSSEGPKTVVPGPAFRLLQGLRGAGPQSFPGKWHRVRATSEARRLAGPHGGDEAGCFAEPPAGSRVAFP